MVNPPIILLGPLFTTKSYHRYFHFVKLILDLCKTSISSTLNDCVTKSPDSFFIPPFFTEVPKTGFVGLSTLSINGFTLKTSFLFKVIQFEITVKTSKFCKLIGRKVYQIGLHLHTTVSFYRTFIKTHLFPRMS